MPTPPPEPVKEQLFAVAGEFPLLLRTSVQTPVPALQLTDVALTCAVAVNDPKRPRRTQRWRWLR